MGPAESAPEVVASFREQARERGWRVVIYAASGRHLEGYRALGLRAACVGEEAIVDPSKLTLDGRRVRKLRQSVHRVERRGWSVIARDGRDIDGALEAEIDAFEAAWRRSRPQLIGFAMAMGGYETGVRASDLYLIAGSPTGELAAVMRFIEHRGKLSLDTMHRLGETPNGLNEALVCRALELARARGIPEVSLNYAGLAHLVRDGGGGGKLKRRGVAIAMPLLGSRFQMERLVRFNEKFSPQWRPRYLVYESRRAFARSAVSVLRAEGYLPEHSGP